MGGRRRILALTLALAAGGQAAVALPGEQFPDEAPPLPPALARETPVVRGPIWYSASLLVPRGILHAFTVEVHWKPTRPFTSTACGGSNRYADGLAGTGAGMVVWGYPNVRSSPPRGHYRVAKFTAEPHPFSPPSTPETRARGPVFQTGSDRGGPLVDFGREDLWCRTWGGSSDDPWQYREFGQRRQDVLVFVASDAPVAWSWASLRIARGVRVLAESWGVGGTHFFREWDFTGGVYARAGDRVPLEDPRDHADLSAGADALVMIGAEKKVRFHHHAQAYFATGDLRPPVLIGLFPSRGILSVTGPARMAFWGQHWNTGVRDVAMIRDSTLEPLTSLPWGSKDWHGDWAPISLAGEPPGRYVFRVEEFLAPALWTETVQIGTPFWGVDPFVWLITADADFPACTALPVRARAPDGHRICG